MHESFFAVLAELVPKWHTPQSASSLNPLTSKFQKTIEGQVSIDGFKRH